MIFCSDLSPLQFGLLFGSDGSQLFKVYEFFASPRHSGHNVTVKIRIGLGKWVKIGSEYSWIGLY